MNIIDVQNKLKGLSEQQLSGEMQSPSGLAPQFLVLSELQRRKRVRDDFQSQQAQPQTTVAQDAVAAAGVPQEAAGQMAQAMAPQTDMAQNTGIASLPMAPEQPQQPMGMASGGVVKMAGGQAVYTDPAIRAQASRSNMSVDEYLKTLGPAAASVIASAERRAARDRMVGTEPSDGIATLQGVNPSYTEDLTGRFPVSGFEENPPELMGRGSVDMSQPPMPSPYRTMTTVPDAIRAGQERGGRGGMTDAMLASNMPVNPREYALDMYEINKANAADNEPYLPGPAAASELNTPAIMRALSPEQRVALELNGPSFRDTPINEDMPFVNPWMERTAALQMAEAAKQPGEQHPDVIPVPPAASPLDAQMSRLALLDEVKAGRAGPQTALPEEGSIWDYFSGGSGYSPAMVAGMGGTPTPDNSVSVNTPPTDPMYEAAKADAEKVAANREALIAENKAAATAKAEETTPVVEPKPPGGGSSSSSSSASYSGPSGGSDYEKALADALARTEKRAEQDKWLSLAQAGMALMASKQPTLGGAVGEAGLAGLSQYQQTRDAAEKDRLGIMGTQFELDMARQKMALARAQAASRGGGSGGGYSSGAERLLDRYDAELAGLDTQLEGLGYGPGADLRAIAETNPDAALTIQGLLDKRKQLAAIKDAVSMQVVPGYAAIASGGGSSTVNLSD